jgi:CheY-like chemotaxis protein
LAVAAALKADAATTALPIIFFSAHADEASKERAEALGAVGYITKPFDPAVLASEIERLVLSAK